MMAEREWKPKRIRLDMSGGRKLMELGTLVDDMITATEKNDIDSFAGSYGKYEDTAKMLVEMGINFDNYAQIASSRVKIMIRNNPERYLA